MQALAHFGSLPAGVDLIVMRQEKMSAAKIADIAAKVSAAGAASGASSLISQPQPLSDSSKVHSHVSSQPLHAHLSSLHINEVRSEAALPSQASLSVPPPQQQHVPPAPNAIPSPWVKNFDPASGRHYYCNSQTNESVWNIPLLEAQSVTPQHQQNFTSQNHGLPSGSQTPFVWKWENDEGTGWVTFEAFEANLLEAAFQRKEGSVQHPQRPWLFNFKDMSQTNVSTGGRRAIRREAAMAKKP